MQLLLRNIEPIVKSLRKINCDTRQKGLRPGQCMAYGQFMTESKMITAAETTAILGYENRSSLTRLVQAGKITPVFTASGKRGEQFFNRAEVLALLTPTGELPKLR